MKQGLGMWRNSWRRLVFIALVASCGPQLAWSQPAVRPEVAAVLQEVQSLLAAQRLAPAKSRLDAASAAGRYSDYESYMLNRLAIAIALAQEDAGGAALAYNAADRLADKEHWMSDTERQPLLQAIASLYYRSKDYNNVVVWTDQYEQAGGSDGVTAAWRTQSLFRTGAYERAANVLELEIRHTQDAGQKPANSSLEMLAQSREKLKDDPGYGRALEMLVTYYPKKQYWQALLARLWNRADLSPWLQVEVGRLSLQTGTLIDTSDHIEFAEMAIKAGYPVDAVKALDQGFKNDLLGSGPDAEKHRVLRARATLLLEQDRQNVEADARKALASGDANAMANIGFNLVLLGRGEQGRQLMTQALEKGVGRRPEVARLHLGAAWAMAGQRESARQVLQGVTGQGGIEELARYWTLTDVAP